MNLKLRLRDRLYSLHFRITILILLPIFMLTALLIVYNAYAISVIRNNTWEVNSQALDVYMDNVDKYMKSMEYYWVGLTTSSDLLTMITTDRQTDYYVALSRLKTDMTSAVQSYEFIDSLFIYQQGRNEYFDAPKYSLSSQERKNMKELVISEIAHAQSAGGLSGGWQSAEIGGHYYLIRIFHMRDTYMGGCISVARLLSTMRESGFSEFDCLTFFGDEGEELGHILPFMEEPLGINGTFQRFITQIGGSRYLVISRPSAYGSHSAVAIISDIGILEGLHSFQAVILVWGVCVIMFLVAFIMMIRRWILSPVDRLCDAMNSLKSGDLDVRLSTGKEPCTEFMLVDETFDNMIENIKALKIDVYEQNMQRQAAEIRQKNTELQYMKEQMRPHFYINCLNVINNLSLMNKNRQIREMTTYLGNQFRYIMGSKTVDTLQCELDFVENYLRIQALCHGDSVYTHIEVDPSVYTVNVPPLIIMTFIDNVCKHQAIAGERVDIYIVCARCEEPERHRIRIEIWDTGEGYPDFVLACIRKGKRIIDDRGEHFGLRNIIARLHLIYDGSATISIQNHWETGGAYVVIELPENTGNAPDQDMGELR